jgi:hypothetical protein
MVTLIVASARRFLLVDLSAVAILRGGCLLLPVFVVFFGLRVIEVVSARDGVAALRRGSRGPRARRSLR